MNGDLTTRNCMFCGRNLSTSIHYRYCSTELHRKSDSLICYKCEQASKKGKLKNVIEKLRKVLKIWPGPRPIGSTAILTLATVQGGTILTQMTLQHRKSLVKYIRVCCCSFICIKSELGLTILHVSMHNFRTNIRIAFQNAVGAHTQYHTHVVCKYCDKVCFDENEIKSDSLLKKHVLEEHPFMVLHQCGLCCFDTTNEIEFNWHLVTHHVNPESLGRFHFRWFDITLSR